MSTTATPPQPGTAAELSEDDVLRWLSSRGLTATHAALVGELTAQGAAVHGARVALPPIDASSDVVEAAQPAISELEGELSEGLCEALAAYADLAGEGAVFALLERWSPSFRTRYLHYAGQPDEMARASAERRAVALEEDNTRLRTRDRELDAQLRQTVAIIAERLHTLTSSVDPMHKDILLPLLRTVAVLGAASTIRTAARHMMLTLYKRPTTEHRLAIVQEWLRVAQEAPQRTLEQELIPELYTLVNAQVFERRLLALDCAAAVAPLLRRSPQVRYSLCQGLLRPLCEDDTSAVRRELPRCLSLLWGESAVPTDAVSAASHAAPKPHTGAVTIPSHAAPSDAASGDAPVGLCATQKTLIMELLVHLATDGNSRTVRQAAQTQLCEVLYPVFLRDGVLLTQFVPLLLTVIGMEATQLLLVRGGSNRGSSSGGGGGPSVSGAAGSGETRKAGADDASASMAAAVSLSNVMALIQLLHAALRCVAAEVLHCREAEGRGDSGGAGGGALAASAVGAAAAASDAALSASSLTWTYVHVVLPTAYNMLAPLLAKVRFASPVAGSEAAAQYASEPSTRLSGPLCALCATLASLVPLLGAAVWQDVVRILEDAIATDAMAGTSAPSGRALGGAATSARSLAAVDASLTPHDAQRGRQLFVFSFLLFLCGDAVALPPNGVAGAAATARPEDGGAPASGLESTSAFSSFTPAPIQAESLSIMARCISLGAEDLSCPRSPALLACVHGVVALAPFAMESHEMASGISSLVDFLVASPVVRLRLTAVVLVHDTCALLANERLKVALLLEPLVPLLRDQQPTVQEAALSGILFASISLTEPRAQERAIRPVLRVADVAGCTARFTRLLLQQCDQLMSRMPAEPREALLYPQLSVLMDRLAEEFVERVSCEGTAAAMPAVASDPTAARRVAGFSGEGGDVAVREWEETMLVLQALLNSIIKSAVVTPTLVYRSLLPGIQQLSSDGVLSACSAAVRSRWTRLHKNYHVFMENNNTSRLAASGGTGSGAAAPTPSTLLDRFKDELKRRL